MTTAPTGKFEISGEQKAALDLKEIGVRAARLEPIKRDLERTFHTTEERQFATRGDGQWPPLAEATLAKKQRLGQNLSILRATDRLYRSLTSEFSGERVDEMEPGRIELGTEVPYAIYHVGTRNPIYLRPSDISRMSEIIGHYIAEGA